MHDVECRRVFDRVFGFVGVMIVFSLNGLGESGCGFWATLVPNNRAGTEETTRDIVEGCEALSVALGTTLQHV